MGSSDQRARDGDALLLAAGELRRRALGERRHAHRGERVVRPGTVLRQRHVTVHQRQGDVLARRRARQQVEALEDEADAAIAQLGATVRVEAPHVDAVEQVGAGGGPIEAAEDVEQRRLAGARRPHDRHQLAGADGEGDAPQRLDRLLGALQHVALAHVAQRDHDVNAAPGHSA